MEIGGQPRRNPERNPWRREEDTIRRGLSSQRSQQPTTSSSKNTQRPFRCHKTSTRSEMTTIPKLSASSTGGTGHATENCKHLMSNLMRMYHRGEIPPMDGDRSQGKSFPPKPPKSGQQEKRGRQPRPRKDAEKAEAAWEKES
ncbi:unnamed protein product [Microthlaspi erraticum]|uniref:Uncharacterized protein n=1 Tax=Microthlaspi erraticum TaxID=1685480 RepID=A0A6D2KHY1_9BRAS|nr:unnamed protein product [Microthlaspi erraticum]